ncbi:TniQ family protein [Streptomyces sioyaensis]|uniref:TniQ family protein n=1 Tax=Streptomyces sioyaensis TaxID=67364 RepID=UPI0037CE9BBF
MRLDPLPGEAFDSWFDALAHRLNVPVADLNRAIGLPGSPHSVYRRDDIPANRVVLLRAHETAALTHATGVDTATLHATTLARYDQRAVLIDHSTRRVNVRTMWGRGRGSRFCPDCLADTHGRWQIRWRLAWSFACTTHQRLLAEVCPACERDQSIHASGQHEPPHPGICASPVSLKTTLERRWKHTRCGADLTTARTLRLPADHPVLRAQRLIDDKLDAETVQFGLYPEPQPLRTVLADLRAIAGRVFSSTLHSGLPDDLAHDPVAARLHRLSRHQHERSRSPRAQLRPGTQSPPPAAGTALGMAVACEIMQHTDLHHAAETLRWLITHNRGKGTIPTYPSTLDDWGRNTSHTFRSIQLSALGPTLHANDQLRYRTGSPAPAPHLDMSRDLARSRLPKVPPMFWPGWAARLCLPAGTYMRLQRPALACALFLIGTRLNHTEATELLGSAISTSALTTVLQRLSTSAYWDGIRTALTNLADYLDAHPVPIDYQRRRRLDYASLLPDGEWEWLCRRAGLRPLTETRGSYARHVLFERLSGNPFTLAPFPRGVPESTLRYRMIGLVANATPEVAAGLESAAQEFLARCGITDEPTVWNPPTALLDSLHLPGPDPTSLDIGRLHRLIRHERAPVPTAARTLGVTKETVQAVLQDHPAPVTPPPLEPSGDTKLRRTAGDI